MTPSSPGRTESQKGPNGAGRSITPFYNGQLLDGLAGTYASKADAQAVVQRLTAKHGLPASQWLMLGPQDASWFRFARLRKRWAQSGGSSAGRNDLLWAAVFGGLLSALSAGAWLALEDGLGNGHGWWAIALAALLGTAASTAVAGLLRRQPPQRRFDQALHRQLRAGRWVVVAHSVPAAFQTRIALEVRGSSMHWYTLSSAQRWL